MSAEVVTRRSTFTLSKWYLDVVAPDGHAVIGYWSEAAWKRFSLRAESVLDAPPAAPSSARSRLTRGAGPREQGRSLVWSSPGLSVDGEWLPVAAPLRRTLLEDDGARVEWICLAPLAETRVSVGGVSTLAGLGYSERLSVSIAGGRLPLDDLRWGRFAGAGHWAVWIMWSGPNPRTLVWVDGVERVSASVHDDRVDVSPTERLTLDRRRVLRSGMPILEAIPHVPGLRRVVPRPLRSLREKKWLSRGWMCFGGGAVEGWAIHEHVRFGEPEP